MIEIIEYLDKTLNSQNTSHIKHVNKNDVSNAQIPSAA